MRISLNPIWPFHDSAPLWVPYAFVAVVGLLLVLLVLLTYPRRVRQLKPGLRAALLALRLAAAGVLVLAMLRPAIRIRTEEDETRYLYIVADASRSMKVPDGAGPTANNTRREVLLQTLAQADDVLQKLGEKVEIRYFDFAETLVERDKLGNTVDGSETNVELALKKLLAETEGKRVLGVVLMGDCAPRVSGRQADSDPRQRAINAARDFADRNIKVHTVPIGESGFTGSAGDLAVVDVNVDTNPYEGKLVAVNATIRAFGAKGRRLSARILVEQGAIPGASGEMVPAKAVKTSKPSAVVVPEDHEAVIAKELTFVPARPGKYKIAVEVSGLPGERNLTNNVMTRIIDVRAGGISVAYFDSLRTEQRWIRKVNASEKIQLDFFLMLGGRLGGARKVDPKIFAGGENAYDVFIIGDVPAKLFGDENLRLLRRRIDEGAGLLMTGGSDSFGGGGWAVTPLAPVLPVKLDQSDVRFRQEELKPRELHYTKPLRMVPTPRGLSQFVMRIAPDGKHKQLWDKLPLLEGANRLQKKTARGADLVEVLARTPDGSPLLLTHTWSGKPAPGAARPARPARVMAFGADTTYLWYLGGFQDAYQRFWRQAILYLAQKEEDEQPVWVKIEQGGRRHFSPAEGVPIRFGARDKEGKSVDNLSYRIRVIGPAAKDDPRKQYNDLIKTQGGAGANNYELRGRGWGSGPRGKWSPGEYWIKVTAGRPAGKRAGEDDGLNVYGTAWERFIVESTDLELDDPAADRKLLESIARQTGGTFVSQPQDFKDFLERLATPQDALEGTERITLWDTWPRLDKKGDRYIPGLLLLFVVLLSVEWFLRKRKGLV